MSCGHSTRFPANLCPPIRRRAENAGFSASSGDSFAAEVSFRCQENRSDSPFFTNATGLSLACGDGEFCPCGAAKSSASTLSARGPVPRRLALSRHALRGNKSVCAVRRVRSKQAELLQEKRCGAFRLAEAFPVATRKRQFVPDFQMKTGSEPRFHPVGPFLPARRGSAYAVSAMPSAHESAPVGPDSTLE